MVMFARTPERLAHAANGIRERFGAEVLAVAGDMTSEADVERLVAETQRSFGGPDILVVNTGRPPLGMRDVIEETDNAR